MSDDPARPARTRPARARTARGWALLLIGSKYLLVWAFAGMMPAG